MCHAAYACIVIYSNNGYFFKAVKHLLHPLGFGTLLKDISFH